MMSNVSTTPVEGGIPAVWAQFAQETELSLRELEKRWGVKNPVLYSMAQMRARGQLVVSHEYDQEIAKGPAKGLLLAATVKGRGNDSGLTLAFLPGCYLVVLADMKLIGVVHQHDFNSVKP